MLEIKKGNVFSIKTDAIAHGANCIGEMGAGAALQFVHTYPSIFMPYAKACKELGPALLGTIQPIYIESANKWIVNCFTQINKGKHAEYGAVSACFLRLDEFMLNHNLKTLSMPAIGCGFGGLKWVNVYSIAHTHFSKNTNYMVYLFEPK